MDPVSHALFPALALLALGVDSKKVVTLLPFAILPDFDTVFGLWAHRVVFHNFIFVILIPLIIFLFVRERYADKIRWVIVGWFFLVSHLILDLQSGFALLWPFSSKAPYISLGITTNLAGTFPTFGLQLDYGLSTRAPELTGEATLMPPQAFLLILLVSLSVLIQRENVMTFLKNFRKFLLDRLDSILFTQEK